MDALNVGTQKKVQISLGAAFVLLDVLLISRAIELTKESSLSFVSGSITFAIAFVYAFCAYVSFLAAYRGRSRMTIDSRGIRVYERRLQWQEISRFEFVYSVTDQLYPGKRYYCLNVVPKDHGQVALYVEGEFTLSHSLEEILDFIDQMDVGHAILDQSGGLDSFKSAITIRRSFP